MWVRALFRTPTFVRIRAEHLDAPPQGSAICDCAACLLLCAATAHRRLRARRARGEPQETPRQVGATKASHSDIREIPSDRLVPARSRASHEALLWLLQNEKESRSALAAGETPVDRHRAAVDRARRLEAGQLYRKDYTLRGVGDKIEVWVASDSDDTSTGTAFPEGDCRNEDRPTGTDNHRRPGRRSGGPSSTTNMYPKESEAFSPSLLTGTGPTHSSARTRAGTAASTGGEGDKIVNAGRQRPGRQLLRLPGRPDLHRRVSSPRSSTTWSTATS